MVNFNNIKRGFQKRPDDTDTHKQYKLNKRHSRLLISQVKDSKTDLTSDNDVASGESHGRKNSQICGSERTLNLVA